MRRSLRVLKIRYYEWKLKCIFARIYADQPGEAILAFKYARKVAETLADHDGEIVWGRRGIVVNARTGSRVASFPPQGENES